MNNTSELISIGIFSMITRLTRRALRLYDEKGLLSPAKKEITGYRQYSYRQIRRGMQLKRLADLGFGINEMFDLKFLLFLCHEQ
ncbi:MAG: MerR family transcriptional regulator [Deltaproteobacteria bacterium]|nr:MerR family transcriptional regulator [Deltaproteobacteria bacterium]